MKKIIFIITLVFSFLSFNTLNVKAYENKVIINEYALIDDFDDDFDDFYDSMQESKRKNEENIQEMNKMFNKTFSIGIGAFCVVAGLIVILTIKNSKGLHKTKYDTKTISKPNIVVEETKEIKQEVKRCEYCGSKVKDSDIECKRCGAKL